MNKQAPGPARVGPRYRVLRWAITVCWACLIFDLSTQGFGSSFTEVMLHRLLALLDIRLSSAHFETLHFLVRKSAHFTEYAIFALLIYFSISQLQRVAWRPRAALWSVVIAGLYSLSDEFHQMFVPNRGPSLKDSALDTAGALIAIALVYLGTRGARVSPAPVASDRSDGNRRGGLDASSGNRRELEDVQNDG